jgi:hypothetical protein
MNNNTIEETPVADALIISGSGYQIEVSQAAIEKRAEVLAASCCVLAVEDNDQSADAAWHVRQLASLRIETERCRKVIKEPVIAIGKRIDKAAKEFLGDIEAEEDRLKRLIGHHAAEVARQRADAEAAERKAADEARRAREVAEAAAQAAEESGRLADLVAAKQAEAERMATLAARSECAEVTSAAKVADGVRFVWDFEVLDEDKVLMNLRPACEIVVKRTPVLDWIRALEKQGEDPEALTKAYGIRAFKKPIVSTR